MMYCMAELREMALWGEGPFKKIPVKTKSKPEHKTEWRGEWEWMLFPVNDQIILELCVGYRPQDKPKPVNSGALRRGYAHVGENGPEVVEFYADNNMYFSMNIQADQNPAHKVRTSPLPTKLTRW